MYTPPHLRQAAAYRQVGVETLVQGASPHQLVALLMEELMRSLRAARAALAQGDVAAKGAAIGKSIRVLEEGLKAGLDMQTGGTIAQTLRTLYDGMLARLTTANLRNDDALLAEVMNLMAPVQDAWREIGPSAPAAFSHQ